MNSIAQFILCPRGKQLLVWAAIDALFAVIFIALGAWDIMCHRWAGLVFDVVLVLLNTGLCQMQIHRYAKWQQEQ